MESNIKDPAVEIPSCQGGISSDLSTKAIAMIKPNVTAPTAVLQLLLLFLFTQGLALEPFTNRILQTNSSGVCSTSLSTYVVTDVTSTNGIVFAVESADTDTVGPTVLSMGFHVDPALMTTNSFQYEVYALNVDGYYADPDRGENILADLGFDYRGQLDAWSLVSSGEIFESDLDVSITTPVSCFALLMPFMIPSVI